MLQIAEEAEKDGGPSWVQPLASEVARVLRPGGRILFVEKKSVYNSMEFVRAVEGLRMDGTYRVFGEGEQVSVRES